MTNVVQFAQATAKDSFDEFWLFFPAPRRQQKALCKAKWDAITNGGLKTKVLDRDSNSYVEIFLQATPADIIAGVKRYDEKMRDKNGTYGSYKDGGKFICSPAVWLNQGRWDD